MVATRGRLSVLVPAGAAMPPGAATTKNDSNTAVTAEIAWSKPNTTATKHFEACGAYLSHSQWKEVFETLSKQATPAEGESKDDRRKRLERLRKLVPGKDRGSKLHSLLKAGCQATPAASRPTLGRYNEGSSIAAVVLAMLPTLKKIVAAAKPASTATPPLAG